MPNMDKTGPLGDGTPGKGRGKCSEKPNLQECGRGRGFNRGCGCQRRKLCCQQRHNPEVKITSK